MTLINTTTAEESYLKIVQFILHKWNKKIALQFIKDVDIIVDRIKENPYFYKPFEENSSVRIGFVNRLVSLYYKINEEKQEIIVLLYFDNRENPEKLEMFLFI